MIELSTEDRERIEQEAASKFIRYPAKKSFILGAEYATRYEREQQAEQAQDQIDSDHIQIKQLEAERSEVIRRIKSILKASTVHDKISILEELEQLLNSLKK